MSTMTTTKQFHHCPACSAQALIDSALLRDHPHGVQWYCPCGATPTAYENGVTTIPNSVNDEPHIDHKRQAEALVILLDGAVKNDAVPEVWRPIEAAMVRLANTIAPVSDPSKEWV